MSMKYRTALIELPLLREAPATRRCSTPADMLNICGDMAGLLQESCQIVTLDAKNKLIGRHMITLGLVNASLLAPREIFRAAILDSASALVMVHNHPSGDPTASAEDIRITKQIIEVGRIVGITVLDHVIIGRDENNIPTVRSLREMGICSF